ncbi:hypothetical protein ISCGN_026180 [Ixodes scapularis]
MVQEVVQEDVSLPGYVTYRSSGGLVQTPWGLVQTPCGPPQGVCTALDPLGSSAGGLVQTPCGPPQGVCTFVRRSLPVLVHELKGDENVERVLTEVLVGRLGVCLCNVYSNPRFGRQRFRNLLHGCARWVDGRGLVVSGDFNVRHEFLGHAATTVKGRNLFQDAEEVGLILVTDPGVPTRPARNAIKRDTTPDLAFVDAPGAEWRNALEDLGSDHRLVELSVPLAVRRKEFRPQGLVNWDAFRRLGPEGEISDLGEWSASLVDAASAFDRVRHSAILRGVADAGFGRRSYNYVKDFLSGRTARLLAGDLDVGVPHSIYADDLTLWCTNRRKEVVQGTLQRGIEIIEEALMGSGLECAPEKSELLVCYAGRCRWDEMRLIAGGGPVPRVDALRVLGLFVQEKAGNAVMLGKIQGKVASALRMIQRVTSRRKGIREAGVMRMVQAFVLSHIMYVAPYLRWRAGEKNKLDAMVRRAYKSALGLYAFTSTKKLEMLGVHNTIGEIVEAHRASQIQRLERTAAGRGVLRRVGLLAEDASDGGG